MKKTPFILVVLTVLFAMMLHAQEAESEVLPPWLILERGKTAYREGDFGEAFRLFRRALEEQQPLPEAHMWMAIIYEEEGEYELAENHYRKALSESKELYILEDAYLIRYRLADMYERSRQFGKYERVLKDIVATDTLSIQDIALRNAMMRNLRESGIDKLLELYRIDVSPCTRAYGSIGIFYYRTGRYLESIEHLVIAVLDPLSSCIDDLLEDNPSYEFLNTETLLFDCMQNRKIASFLERTGFFGHLYYLACALFAESEIVHAQTLWTLVASYDTGTEWTDRAARQLRAPFIEPVLTVSGL